MGSALARIVYRPLDFASRKQKLRASESRWKFVPGNSRLSQLRDRRGSALKRQPKTKQGVCTFGDGDDFDLLNFDTQNDNGGQHSWSRNGLANGTVGAIMRCVWFRFRFVFRMRRFASMMRMRMRTPVMGMRRFRRFAVFRNSVFRNAARIRATANFNHAMQPWRT